MFLCATSSLYSIAFTSPLIADDADKEKIEFFEKKIRPLLVAKCYECHSGKEANGGLRLDTKDFVIKGGDTGPALTPGDPDESLLIEAIRYKNTDLQMPPKNPLSAEEIALLEKWVGMGAPDPRDEATPVVSSGPSGMSIEEGRQFWSFMPIKRANLPLINERDWIQTPVDAFVLHKLEAIPLRHAQRADKRTLIRRVTFDLVGLPPTPVQIETFLADESPDAFERLVDRLLADPGYGVRWGRHWLDVARYADSNGLDENLAFGNAWRYRDYVVDSFNVDKPFNRFVVEQIAGDQVEGANLESRTGTGFLVLGAKVLAEPDREKLMMDTIDEQLDATGKAFLGMTLGCVRCHDHKFDPIKQTDYYGLAALFKSTKTFGDTNFGAIKHWNEFSFASSEEQEKLKSIDAEIAKKKEAATGYRNQAMEKIRSEARSKGADYLMASTKVDVNASLVEMEKVATDRGLHPRILFQCRRHLEFHRDDPFFEPWHRFAAVLDEKGIEAHYRPLFAEMEEALAKERAKTPPVQTLVDPRFEAARAALYDTSGFLAVPPKPEFAFDAATLAEYYRLSEEARIVESRAPDEPSAMSVIDGTVLTSLPIHIRGSHNNLGASVSRRFPEVMTRDPSSSELPADRSGRLEFAKWLTSDDHPLTARVIVNRIWRWHLGKGIVASTDNFGKLGDKPSHPELLDWLASEFMHSGWSIKELHRLVLSSNTYQMDSVHPDETTASTIDPEINYLWRFRRQRLEAEEIRDSILFVAGSLDQSIAGKSVPLRNRQFVFDHTSIDHTTYESTRRAIYLPVIRNNVYTLFEQFDFPEPTSPTGDRHTTIVAPQALLLMNSDLVMDSADAMADLLLTESIQDADRIRAAYRLALGRYPNEEETEMARKFIGDVVLGSDSKEGHGRAEEKKAWSLFCQSLLASNEFMYLR
ncbi:PSD1 and planctomycete cytochrome C domain-containing protein [bacterium]|nr:PSD1 and planctomycete cytochrome C domain-containing protein [bacterium]